MHFDEDSPVENGSLVRQWWRMDDPISKDDGVQAIRRG